MQRHAAGDIAGQLAEEGGLAKLLQMMNELQHENLVELTLKYELQQANTLACSITPLVTSQGSLVWKEA